MYMKQIFRSLLLPGVIFLSLGSSVSQAAPEGKSHCYTILKENLAELHIFADAEKTLRNLPYPKLKEVFSPYYKNISSFGVDLSDPNFEMRLYSFGEQTGYVHPPQGPFPLTTKSDEWENPVKQNIIAEEYLKTPQGGRLFLGCAFFQIESDDLESVTNDRYVYDGELMGAIKIHENYKAWYNENESFDEDDTRFVKWKRLFVYPKFTQNEYFSKYDVLDGMPANRVESFEVVFPPLPEGEERVDYVVYEAGGRVASTSNQALAPVRVEGNEVFPFNSYYKAIEAAFPEFSELLSIKGALSYTAFRKLLLLGNDAYENALWSTIVDTKEITAYAIGKEKGTTKEDPVMESLIAWIPELESRVEKLVVPEMVEPDVEIEEPEYVDPEALEVEEIGVEASQKASLQDYWIVLLVLGGLVVVVLLLYFLFKKKNA